MRPKTLPKGTTPEQWDRYEREMAAHKEMMESKKPDPAKFLSEADDLYRKAVSEWRMAYHCDAPNEPGYYRANND